MKRNADLEASGFAFRLDGHSGVPVYRQLIDQVQGAMAAGMLRPGDQLPTVRLVAVELAINPNTVMRAYREMEIRGILDTQQGTGTFIAENQAKPSQEERERKLAQLAGEFISRAGAAGLTVTELIDAVKQLNPQGSDRR
ncbi:MAG TPA: GntR family transcriptional regulator [Terracidiphilus sp.]|jgi:GntR family transcriptional regulator|nr:GntR family transcriptional regulator [Terracidiphilus sp.]